VIKLEETKKRFVLLAARRWVGQRSLGWLNRFWRLARAYERRPEHCLRFIANLPCHGKIAPNH
jgi:hypothetical protein